MKNAKPKDSPCVVRFAARVAAWLRSDASDDAYNRTALWGSSRTDWDADAIEEAAKTGGPLPGEVLT